MLDNDFQIYDECSKHIIEAYSEEKNIAFLCSKCHNITGHVCMSMHYHFKIKKLKGNISLNKCYPFEFLGEFDLKCPKCRKIMKHYSCDSAISPIIFALNKFTKYHTTFSCEGHGSPLEYMTYPYILFDDKYDDLKRKFAHSKYWKYSEIQIIDEHTGKITSKSHIILSDNIRINELYLYLSELYDIVKGLLDHEQLKKLIKEIDVVNSLTEGGYYEI